MNVCVLATIVMPSSPNTMVGVLSGLGSLGTLNFRSDLLLESDLLMLPRPRLIDCMLRVDMMERTDPRREGMISLFLSKGMISSSAYGSVLRKDISLAWSLAGSISLLDAMGVLVSSMAMLGTAELTLRSGVLEGSLVSLSSGLMGASVLGVSGDLMDSADGSRVSSGIEVASGCFRIDFFLRRGILLVVGACAGISMSGQRV